MIAKAFEMAAADFVLKPFSPTELAARIRTALHRRDAPDPSAPYVLGDLTVNYDDFRLTPAGRPDELTVKTYGTLAELSTNAGRVLTYGHLLRTVWGSEDDAAVRPIGTVISSLRRKLGDNADNPTHIFVALRAGYRMPKNEDRKSHSSAYERIEG